MIVLEVDFLKSATQKKEWPPADKPEVAFCGRSNVGKSSCLNALVGRKAVARVSRTPGRTRLLNFFDVSVAERSRSGGHGRPRELRFVDLPGYGYARVGKAQRGAFRGLVKHTLRRDRLQGVVWLLDIRHPLSAEDQAMQDALAEEEKMRVLAALTKGDKLSAGKRSTRERELRGELGLPEDQVVVTSAKTGEGIADLKEAIAGLISGVTK